MKEDKKVPQLRFPEFTDAWKQRKLGDILKLLKDGTHGSHKDVTNGHYLLSAKNIKDGRIFWDKTDRIISDEDYKKIHSTFKINKGDVLLTIVGSIGETAIFNVSEEITFQRSVAILRPIDEVSSDFLYSEITSPKFQKFLNLNKSTSAQPGIYLGDLANISFSFPENKEEQKMIGRLFTGLNSTITLQQLKLNSLQKLKKGLLQKMFPKNGENIPEIRFPEFSDAWKQRKLGDILKLLKDGTHGSHKDVTNGHYLLSAKNIKDGRIFWDKTDRIISDEDYKKIHSTFKINKGDVLLTIVGSIGETAIFNVSEEITFQRSVAILRPIDEVSSDFLYSEITSPKFQKFLNLNKSTSAQPGIYLGDLANISFSFPENKEEQKMIGRLFTGLNSTITLQQRKLNSLQKLQKRLLQKMFPKKGENITEIRFPEFSDAWKQRKVKELCSISTGKSNTQDKVDDGEYPFYVRSPIVERSKKYLYDEEAVLTVGDGVGTGKVFHYVNGKYDLHQRCYRMFNFSEELNAKYFYHIFSKMFYKRVMSMTAKTSVDSVRMDMIADMEIPVPNIKEQEKIGAFFSDIDNLITLQQRWLFYTHKQS